MKRRSTQFLIGAGLLFVGLVMVIALPLFLNPAYFKEMAFEYMQRTLGPHISVGETTLSLFPYPHVEVAEVIVKERPDTHAFFRAKLISLDLKIGSLLRQEFAVRELHIDHPEIEIKRDREGQWWMLQSNKGNTSPSFLSSLFFMEEVGISNGRITVIDETPLEEARGIVFESVYLSLVAQESSIFSATLVTSGEIRRPQGTSVFFWNGLVELNPSDFPQAVKRDDEPAQSLRMDGKIKIRDLDIGQVTEIFFRESSAAGEIGLANIEGHMTLMPGQIGYAINLSDLSLKSQAGSFSGNANLSGLMTSDLTMFMSFQSTPVSLKAVQRVIPRNRLPPTIIPILEGAEIGGSIRVVQATVAGSTRPDVGISVVGTFQLDESFWKPNTGSSSIENVRGEIVVEPDRIRFSEFTGIYDSLPVHAAKGLILYKESGPWLEVDLQSKVIASRIVDVLTRLVPSQYRNSFLFEPKGLEGDGDLRVQFGGLLGSKKGVLLKSGEYVSQNLKFRTPQLSDQISIEKGRILFSPIEIKFDEVNGSIGESPFRMTGVIKTAQRPVFDRFNVQAILKETLLSQFLRPSSRSLNAELTGGVTLQAVLSGFVKSPKLKGEFDLLDSGLQLSGVVEKQRGVPGSLKFEVDVRDNGQVIIEQAELAMLPFRLSVRGKVRLRPSFEVHARVSTGPIYLGLLPDGVIVGKQFLRSGILEVSLDVRGRGQDWRNWKPTGWVALTEGIVDVKDLPTPITNLFFRLKMNPTIAEVKRLEFKMAKSDVHVTGSIKHWNDKPEIDVVLESSRFDLDFLVPKGKRSSLRDMLEDLAAKTTVVGNIHIDRPMYKKLKAKNLSGLLKIRDGLVTLDRIRGMAYGQPVMGRVFLHLPQHKPAAVRSSFHLKGLPFENLNQSVGQEERLWSGQLSVRGMVQGHGRDPRGVLSTLNGNMDVVIEQGHVQKGTVFPRILTLLNLPTLLGNKVDLKQQGFPFKKVTATLQLEDGVLTSQNVIVDSPIMKMTTVGQYDIVTDQLDIVAAVSPFGQYSEFLKKIPLFGRILAGNRKGIATALFQVRGSLTAPDVRYMPLQSFTTGLTGLSQLAFDILKNTVTLPVELINSNKNDSGKKSSPGTHDRTAPLP